MDCKGFDLDSRRVAQIEEAERLIEKAMPSVSIESEVEEGDPRWADIIAKGPRGVAVEVMDIPALSESFRYAFDGTVGTGNLHSGVTISFNGLQ